LRRFLQIGQFRTFSEIVAGPRASASLTSFGRTGATVTPSISPAALRFFDHKRAARAFAPLRIPRKTARKFSSPREFSPLGVLRFRGTKRAARDLR
jgi:hypothetical protein